MAVAARPGPSDARVPCPLCGGLIHPIAGKCKHCKADLTSYHAARPAASTPLPALHPAAVANGHAHGRASTHSTHAPAGHAVPVPATLAYDASQPVLPPRPTDRSYPTAPRASGLRSWPVLVIIVAMVAIVVAVVLMIWPSNRLDPDGKRTIAPPPAPEHMQTEPEIKTAPPSPQAPGRPTPAPSPPPGQAGATPDPWSGNQVDPSPPSPGAGPPAPDTDTGGTEDDADLDTRKNPFDPPQTPTAPGRHRLQLNGRGTVMLTVMEHLCRKMLECNAGDPMARSTCDSLSRQALPPPASCPAANRCIHLIDAMSCGSQTDSFAQLSLLMSQLHDCSDAIQC